MDVYQYHILVFANEVNSTLDAHSDWFIRRRLFCTIHLGVLKSDGTCSFISFLSNSRYFKVT